MSNYTLNGKDMTAEYGFVAGRADGNLALKGAWDMPARMDKTYHDWGGESGIEPYVLPSEIRFGGRDVVLNGYIKGTDAKDCQVKAYKLYSDIGQYTALVPLVSDKFGSWSVLVNGEIVYDHRGGRIAKLTIPFRQPIVDLTGNIPVSAGGTVYGIDGISFSTLGLSIISMTSYGNRPAPKQIAYTSYQTEGYRLSRSGAREITIRAFYSKPTYTEFVNGLKALYALLAKPGLRTIIKPNDMVRDFFVTKGVSVTRVSSYPTRSYAFLDFSIIETNAYATYQYLTDMSDQEIIDMADNNIIIGK